MLFEREGGDAQASCTDAMANERSSSSLLMRKVTPQPELPRGLCNPGDQTRGRKSL